MSWFGGKKKGLDVALELVAIGEIRKNLVERQREILDDRVRPQAKLIREAISDGSTKRKVVRMVGGVKNSLSIFLSACAMISNFLKVDKNILKGTKLERLFR
jgi:hypothetical protein